MEKCISTTRFIYMVVPYFKSFLIKPLLLLLGSIFRYQVVVFNSCACEPNQNMINAKEMLKQQTTTTNINIPYHEP